MFSWFKWETWEDFKQARSSDVWKADCREVRHRHQLRGAVTLTE